MSPEEPSGSQEPPRLPDSASPPGHPGDATADAADEPADADGTERHDAGADDAGADDAGADDGGSPERVRGRHVSDRPTDDPPREAAPARRASAPRGPRPRPRPASIGDHLVTVEDHLERILRGIGPLAPYDQPLVESLGLPLHEDFVAPSDLPRFANSAMDGYAVRAQDIAGASESEPVTLPVVGDIHAGSARPFAISPGQAVKIMTGAPVPRGADTVVPFEQTDHGDSRVSVRAALEERANVRAQGDDVLAGEMILPAGTVLGPREVSLIAALGEPRVTARPRPRVVIISTGNELRDPGSHLEHDSIYDGNSYMLAAAVRAAGAISYRVGALPDDAATFRRVLSEQLVRADLVVTSGGISKGEADIVKETLSELGTVTFSEVAMQPGKPQGFGHVLDDETPIVNLPGNPVSAYVSFEVFVLPAIRRLMGRTPYRRPMVHAVLASDLRSPSGRRQYVRAVFEVTHRGAKVTPLGGHGSHLVGSLAKANALVVVGEDETALNLGDTVRTLVLDRPF